MELNVTLFVHVMATIGSGNSSVLNTEELNSNGSIINFLIRLSLKYCYV